MAVDAIEQARLAKGRSRDRCCSIRTATIGGTDFGAVLCVDSVRVLIDILRI
jgi:hypothetical protein